MTVNGGVTSGKWAASIMRMAGNTEVRSGLDCLRDADLGGSTLEGIEGEELNVRGAVVDVAQALAIAEAHGAVIR